MPENYYSEVCSRIPLKKYYNDLLHFLVILCGSCLMYFPLLGSKTKNPDALIALPPLFDVKTPFEYLKMLSEFQVVDFQPVRDLTFFWDIAIYKLTGVVTFATTNVFLWAAGIFLFFKLLRRLCPEKEKAAIYWSLAFASYPLFSQAVAWGMARKHILAFLLILGATHAFLNWLQGKDKIFKVYVWYVLACLSHPITLLWPLWAATYLALFEPAKLKEEKKSFIIFAFTATALGFTNYAYYTVGNEAVSEVFWNIRPNLFDVPKLFIHFCFYLRQIVFPYQLGFLYYPETISLIPGVAIFIVTLGVLYRFRKDKKFLSWVIFAALPFPIILGLPGVFDQYLLIPVAGISLIAFQKLGNPSKGSMSFLILVTLIWSVLTFHHARLWTEPRLLSERNFQSVKSCKSANDFLNQTYFDELKAPPELLKFMHDGNCLNLEAGAPIKQQIGIKVLESMMMYYEDGVFPYEHRISRLLQLGKSHYFPLIVFAALKAKEGDIQEVQRVTEFVLEKAGSTKLETGSISDKVLRPFCEEHQLEACLKVTVPYSQKYPFI